MSSNITVKVMKLHIMFIFISTKSVFRTAFRRAAAMCLIIQLLPSEQHWEEQQPCVWSFSFFTQYISESSSIAAVFSWQKKLTMHTNTCTFIIFIKSSKLLSRNRLCCLEFSRVPLGFFEHYNLRRHHRYDITLLCRHHRYCNLLLCRHHRYDITLLHRHHRYDITLLCRQHRYDIMLIRRHHRYDITLLRRHHRYDIMLIRRHHRYDIMLLRRHHRYDIMLLCRHCWLVPSVLMEYVL